MMVINTSVTSPIALNQVQIYNGAAGSIVKGTIEANIGSALPCAFSGLRSLLRTLQTHYPSVAEVIAHKHPQEWNQLFPATIKDVALLSDLALSPSERRLHRESELVFRTLNVAAEMIVETLRQGSETLVLRNAGCCDLVSLRGLVHACEWMRIDQRPYSVIFADWETTSALPETILQLRYRSMNMLAARLNSNPTGTRDENAPSVTLPENDEDFESTCLRLVQSNAEPALRIAASILAIRSCFYSTNYEGTLFAITHALSLMDAADPGTISAQEVQYHFTALDDKNLAPAIEIDVSMLESEAEIRAVLWRSSGVVQSLFGDHAAALDAFRKALEYNASPETQAQLSMYIGLLLAKKLHRPEEAIIVLHHGLSLLEGRESDRTKLEEGWLRNVIGLTLFQQHDLQSALREEQRATSAVGHLHDPRASHLKINLISNISVLQESAKRYDEAIKTWQRFAAISSQWGTSFWKHHTYRLAGLHLALGDRELAFQEYCEAYARATTLDDSYHRQVIAGELGRFLLEDGQKEQALEWFQRAYKHAEAIGDPFHLGESLIGEALSTEGSIQQGLEMTQLSTTYARQAQQLQQAATEDDLGAVLALLPEPRSKLNRPFDIVTINL